MTTQHPSWLPQADRVYAQAGEQRGKFDAGFLYAEVIVNGHKLWLSEQSLRPIWTAALDRYTGDKSDGPVSLVERECDRRGCENGSVMHWEHAKCYTVIDCEKCSGNGKVYEIVRDELLDDLVYPTMEQIEHMIHGTDNEPVECFNAGFIGAIKGALLARGSYCGRIEIDERECETCRGHGFSMSNTTPIVGGELRPEKSVITDVPCFRCNGNGKRPAESYTVKRET